MELQEPNKAVSGTVALMVIVTVDPKRVSVEGYTRQTQGGLKGEAMRRERRAKVKELKRV